MGHPDPFLRRPRPDPREQDASLDDGDHGGIGRRLVRRLAASIDVIASEYGWSIEYIGDLTLEEMNLLAEAIQRRRYEEHRFQASLMGAKMRPFPVSFDDEPSAGLDERLDAAKAMGLPIKDI